METVRCQILNTHKAAANGRFGRSVVFLVLSATTSGPFLHLVFSFFLSKQALAQIQLQPKAGKTKLQPGQDNFEQLQIPKDGRSFFCILVSFFNRRFFFNNKSFLNVRLNQAPTAPGGNYGFSPWRKWVFLLVKSFFWS